MGESTKGLERRGRRYRERIGDYCADYDRTPDALQWHWLVRRRSTAVAYGSCGKLYKARALAATAIALEVGDDA